MNSSTIRVELPAHLRTLARVSGHELLLPIEKESIGGVLDALEAAYPMLRGTVRDHVTRERRPFLRFFACQEDLSLLGPEATLPAAVLDGREPFIILGSIAGG